MTMQELQHEQIVRFRVGKAGDTKHEYGEWKTGELWICCREKDLPVRLRNRTKFWRKGDLVTLKVPDWPPDYGPEDYCGDGVFMAEEWCLQIEGLK